jgi:hypothetical protein
MNLSVFRSSGIPRDGLRSVSLRTSICRSRKVRLLKQLFPEVNIKIFYGRDYRRLLFKFGEMAQ